MRKIKAILSIILVFAIGIGGSGCMSAGKDLYKNQSEIQAEKAEEMLKEKYGKEFVVDSLGGRWGTATDATYTCMCHPADDENLSFKAIVSKEYSFMRDGYATKIGELNFENNLIEVLENNDIKTQVYVGSGVDMINSNNIDMSLEEFISANNGSEFLIFILISETTSADEVINVLKSFFENYKYLNCRLFLYIASDAVLDEFSLWKQNALEYDDDCELILDKCIEREYKIINGSFD